MTPRKIELQEDEEAHLSFAGRLLVEFDFSVAEQKLEIRVHGSKGASSTPVLLFVDTRMLGHTEDEES
ncbi:MAG TPA: hypothetical protein VIP46_02735 [Pyrinomonadaceae bacterium]